MKKLALFLIPIILMTASCVGDSPTEPRAVLRCTVTIDSMTVADTVAWTADCEKVRYGSP